jgi:drug/metabolite transporter (DMT)-like permease
MLWEPVFGVVLAAVFLGETLGPVQLVGGTMVLAAAVILQVGSRPDREPLSPAAELV